MANGSAPNLASLPFCDKTPMVGKNGFISVYNCRLQRSQGRNFVESPVKSRGSSPAMLPTCTVFSAGFVYSHTVQGPATAMVPHV